MGIFMASRENDKCTTIARTSRRYIFTRCDWEKIYESRKNLTRKHIRRCRLTIKTTLTLWRKLDGKSICCWWKTQDFILHTWISLRYFRRANFGPFYAGNSRIWRRSASWLRLQAEIRVFSSLFRGSTILILMCFDHFFFPINFKRFNNALK